MNNAQNQQNNPQVAGISSFFKEQYDKELFKREWKEKSRALCEQPLQSALFILEQQSLQALQVILVWRLLTPAFVTDSFFELFVITPIYLIKYIFPTENNKGTLQAFLQFGINSCTYNLVLCIMSMPLIIISDSFTKMEQFGLFPLIMIEISTKLFEKLNSSTDLYIATVPNLYVLPILYFWAVFFMNESIMSAIAVALVSYAIANKVCLTHRQIPIEKLKGIENKLSNIFSKFPNYISVDQGFQNEEQSSDDQASFDRRQITGRVATSNGGRFLPRQNSSSNLSTEPNSNHGSENSSMIGGTQLGGDASDRQRSKLLNNFSSDNSADNSLAGILLTQRSSEEDLEIQDEEMKLNQEN